MSELPDGWAEDLAMNACALVQSGGTPTKDGFTDESGVPFLKVYNIVEQRVAFSYKPQFISLEAHNGKGKKSQILPGDVLMNIVGPPLGKVAVVPDTFPEWNCNQALTIFRPSEAVTTDWLYNFLRSGIPVSTVVGETRGVVGQVNISLSQCRNFAIPIPPLPEQRRIVAKLDRLSARTKAARAHLARVQSLATRAKQATLAAAFRGELTADWRNKSTCSEDVDALYEALRDERQAWWIDEQRSKRLAKGQSVEDGAWTRKYKPMLPVEEHEKLFELPKGWTWLAAEEAVEPGAEIVYGIVQPGPRLDKGVPYVRGLDIVDGVIQTSQLLKTSPEIAAKYARASLRGGDILLGIIRATKVAVVPSEIEGANITQGTARFRPSRAFRTAFLARWLEGQDAQKWLHSKYRGIDMPGLNLRDVRRCPVPLTSLEEQDEIVRRIEAAFVRIDRMVEEATRAAGLLDRLDERLLARAFRGELVPQDPTDEPASTLLARIQATRAATPKPKRTRRKTSAAG